MDFGEPERTIDLLSKKTTRRNKSRCRLFRVLEGKEEDGGTT